MTPTYFEAMDYPALRRDFPVESFLDDWRGVSADELRARQDRRFRQILTFAWQIPFYQRHWGAQGIEPGDIKGLDDLAKLPVYSKSDLMASVEAHPPLGDFHGLDTYPPDARPPLIFQTTSGTTGRPQPLLWGPKSREVQNALLARLYHLQGIRRSDVVHSVYGFGMVNGGHYIRETLTHWIGAQVLSAGTGAETSSVQQVRLMADFGATVIVGFGDYLRRLAEVAVEQGLTPGEDLAIRLISGHFGADGAAEISALWNAPVFDWYGVGDTGCIAGQGPDRDGLHILEDAQFVELLDPETLTPVADGEDGDLVCTCLYKDDIFPIIRFQTHDVTRIVSGSNPLDLPFRRMAGLLGRSDNMVKLRGINVYPQGIGALLAGRFPQTNGEYICLTRHVDGREEMEVVVEVTSRTDDLSSEMESALKDRLGVQIGVRLVDPGQTADMTGLESRQKPIRLIREAP